MTKIKGFHLLLPLLMLVSVLLIPSILGQALAVTIITALLLYQAKKKGFQDVFGTKFYIILFFVAAGVLPIMFVTSADGSKNLFSISFISITEDSLRLALLVFLRCIASFECLMLLTTLCPIYFLIQYLRTLHVPKLVIELFEFIYRYIFILEETARSILTAQRARLAYDGFRSRIEDAGIMFAQTFVLAHHDSENMYHGLLSRGYEESDEEEVNSLDSSHEKTSSPKSILKMKDVCFGYKKDKTVLKEINLEIFQSEKIVLLGENGSGKSTLFLLLNAINQPSSGGYILNGIPLTQKRKVLKYFRQKVGLVMQNANHQIFMPSVKDEIAFGLKNIGVQEDELEKRVDDTIYSFGLKEIMDKSPHLLSEGQKKWLSIASIVAMDPDIILLDEPTANLDRYYTNKVLSLLDQLHEKGKTVIVSTHDMDFAYSWGNRALVLHNGELVADDTPCSIFSQQEILDLAHLEHPSIYRFPTVNVILSEVSTPEFPKYFPIFVHKDWEKALIFGGGKGAYRKIQSLVRAGISVKVISPELDTRINDLAHKSIIKVEQRKYIPGEIWAYNLVIAATGILEIDQAIAEECYKKGILVNVLSKTSMSTFQLAASCSESGFTVAVQSHYQIPEGAKLMRDYFEEILRENVDVEHIQTLSLLRKQMINCPKESPEEYSKLHSQYEAQKKKLKQILNKNRGVEI